MLFNSIDFAIFLPVVFLLYWFVTNRNLKLQNLLVVVASYVFYGWWDWRFLSLIVFSTLVDFWVGTGLHREQNHSKRKMLLLTSIIVNLGLLGFFKYFNFFVENFRTAFTFFGTEINASSLNIILPVGISFYTFQTLSYSIDIYRRKLEPTRDFIAFSAFVSFFPQLVAGPIERASNLLPQFYAKRQFNYAMAVDGMRQILWGMFKKVVIADRCAGYVNDIFANSAEYSGSTLALGAFFFAFQIYGDFSGYSDIAIGTSRLFGFNIMRNFHFPYFSRDMAEFWRRWHISLSTWFRDYVYIPLGGSRVNKSTQIRNTLIIFVVSGFWHGANWTFIVWGLLNALFIIPLILTNANRKNLEIAAKDTIFPSLKEFGLMLLTFGLTVFAWIFFRAENLSHAFSYIGGLFSDPGSYLMFEVYARYRSLLLFIMIMVGIEWFGRKGAYGISGIDVIKNRIVRRSIYLVIGLFTFMYYGKQQEFIYFQF